MNTMQKMVRDFHRKYDTISSDTVELPSAEMNMFRARLIVEEAGEFLKAATHKDVVEMVDALCDILYVTFGTADVMGVDLEPLFNEVQRSNMTKEGKDESGKIRKGPNYSPPDLRSLLIKQIKSNGSNTLTEQNI